VLEALEAQAAQQGGAGGRAPSAAKKLKALLRSPQGSPERAEFMQQAGLKALLLLRHMEAPSGEIVSGGFACSVIADMVNAALEPPLALEASTFSLKLGVLCVHSESLGGALPQQGRAGQQGSRAV
jgi:hypothetical protein